MGERDFAVSYDPALLPLMIAVGAGPRFTHVTVTGDELKVAMGWAFRATVPRSSIRDAGAYDGRVIAWGVHGFRGRWLVNGSSRGMVRVTIDPPARAYVLGVPVRLRELLLSVEAPGFFVATVRPRAAM
jgi:hypothetical protein